MVVNDGQNQRSRVTKVRVPAADYPDGAVLVRVTGDPMKVIPTGQVVGPDLVLTFATDPQCEHGSLPDGRWAVVPLKGHFHRLFGDSSGDATVDSTDFLDFANTYGLSSSSPEFNAAFDGNADGTIDSTDWLDFTNRYGVTI